jgi:Cu2+-exporting ATPase
MSIAGATSIAKDMAEIIFMDGSLDHLVPLVELSRRLEINLQRSWILCIVPGFINLLGAFVLDFNVLAALLVNNVFSTVGVSGVYYTREKVIPRLSNGSPEEICPVDPAEIIP